MGEAKRRSDVALREVVEALAVETAGGRVQVRWSKDGAATPFGQMAFFIEFLNLTGLYRRWQESCPLTLRSPNASKIHDILGTLFLSVLSGHRRYAHITALRADGVIPVLLGMSGIVAEDTVRRGLMGMDEEAGRSWLQGHLDASVLPLLWAPWIMDIECDGEAPVWQTGRGGERLQPEETGTTLARLPHLPDGDAATDAWGGGGPGK